MKSLIILLALTVGGSGWAAVPEKRGYPQGKPENKLMPHKLKSSSKKKINIVKPNKNQMIQVMMGLRLPHKNRIDTLRGMGAVGFSGLKSLAFDKTKSLQVRWRALTTLGQAFPGQAMSTLEKALRSRKWFMRNAGLIAMSHVSKSRCLSWSSKLLNDSALVVRTSAVQIIEKLNGQELHHQLWTKLYSRENFKNGRSLWIRKHISKALARFAKKGHEGRFIKILGDSDVALHPFAIAGLEKLRGQKASQLGFSMNQKRASWLRWWKKSQPKFKSRI